MDDFFRDEEESTRSPTAPLVYVDTREVGGLVEKLRERGARIEVRQLEIGDFVLSEDVVVERKQLPDFVKSVFDGRLFKQLSNMNEKYSRPILVVEGEKKRLSGIGESAFYGALASVLSDFKTPVYFAANENEVVEIIYHVSRREQLEKKRDNRVREGRKPVTIAESQKYIVAGIPGIDSVLADRLLSELGSIEVLFSATEGELTSVEGIGAVTARRIRELATARYMSSGPAATTFPDSQVAASNGPQVTFDQIRGAAERGTTVTKEVRTITEDLDIPPPSED